MNNVKILFQDEFEQLKKVRRIVNTMEEAEKLTVCLNHWSDDDSWGGTFRYNEIIAEDLYEDWFVNMKMLEQLVVDEDGVIQGYISFDHHGVDQLMSPYWVYAPQHKGKVLEKHCYYRF